MKYFRIAAISVILLAIAVFDKLSGDHRAASDGHDHDGSSHAQSFQSEGEAHDHDHDHADGEEPESSGADIYEGMTDTGPAGTANAPVSEADHDHDETGSISVDPAWEALVGLKTVPAEIRAMETVITLPGKIIAHADKKALVSPLIDASINCLFVQPGAVVNAGDELACLSSPEIGMLRADYDKADADLALAIQNYDRKKALFDEKVISERAFEEVQSALKIAEVAQKYAEKRLMALGITRKELKEPPKGHSEAEGSTVHIHAPISGVVTLRQGFIGQKVDPSFILFEIVDATTVWCELDLFEKQLVSVREGQPVYVRVSAFADDVFKGRLFHIGNTLSESTKTIKLLAELDNPHSKLKPGMYATTEIVTGIQPNTLAVPRQAVLEDEQLQVVFVREGANYHRHVVKTGIVTGEWVEILEGVEKGAVVVTQGNYQLRSKAKMGSVDPHAGHVH